MTQTVSMPEHPGRDACGSASVREETSVCAKSVDVKPDPVHNKIQKCPLEQPSSCTGDQHRNESEDTRHLVPLLQGNQKELHPDDQSTCARSNDGRNIFREVGDMHQQGLCVWSSSYS